MAQLFGPFILFCFVLFLTFFHFLTDLKYTGRLIAGSLSAFSSKIINPQVSYRHPLILFISIFFFCWIASYSTKGVKKYLALYLLSSLIYTYLVSKLAKPVIIMEQRPTNHRESEPVLAIS